MIDQKRKITLDSHLNVLKIIAKANLINLYTVRKIYEDE